MLGNHFCNYHFTNKKGTGAEMHPAIASGMVTGDAQVSYWSFPSNSPRSPCAS